MHLKALAFLMKRDELLSAFASSQASGAILAEPTWRVSALFPQKRDKIAQLFKLFSSARKRSGLSSDEVLIFFAIGYLGVSVSNNIVTVRSVRFADVALTLGIPKETVRRKTIRLADLDYVSVSKHGISIKHYDAFCRMFERATI